MVFEWNCGCLHLPQSAVFNAVSDFGIPRGDAKFARDFGTGVPKLRGCQNHCDSGLRIKRSGTNVKAECETGERRSCEARVHVTAPLICECSMILKKKRSFCSLK